MTNGFDEMILNMTDTTPEPEDYTGEDVTATRQNVTASGQSVRNGKPQRNSAVTLKLSSG